MKKWDVFISYASSDREEVVRPLVDLLHKAGVRVWLDEHQLKMGDSLSVGIDSGIANSRFGVVILSKDFLTRFWPKKELAALRALEESGEKIILPVWHDVDKATIAQVSPSLADLLGVHTSEGIKEVAAAVIDNVFSPGSGSPSQEHPTLSRRLVELLDSNPTKDEFLAFLSSHLSLFNTALDIRTTSSEPFYKVVIANIMFDVVQISVGNFTGLALGIFLPLWSNPCIQIDTSNGDKITSLHPSVVNSIESIRDSMPTFAHRYIESYDSLRDIANELHMRMHYYNYYRRSILEAIFGNNKRNIETRIFVFAGRRKYLETEELASELWEEYARSSDKNVTCYLRTYDWMIESIQAKGY